ncbi:MAG: DUF456 domain-containing protein [Planctomycetota bacterium]
MILIYIWLTLFIVILVLFWTTNLLGVPGNWLLLAAALVWMFIGPSDFRFGWFAIIMLLLLAGLGELIEFGASVVSTKRLGGTNRGATCSLVGSIVGGIAGAFLGIPIPIPLIGMVIGSILFAGIGAWIGATIGERWAGKSVQESVQIGGAAFLGRILGTVGKVVIGLVMVVFTVVSMFYSG